MDFYDVHKLKAATLYILNKCGTIDYIHLFKILYFAERKKISEYGTHLVKDTFCALRLGPVPTFLYDAVKKAAGNRHRNTKGLEIISEALVPGDGERVGYYVGAKENADTDWLSEVDMEILDWAIASYKDKDSDALSQESHDVAWREAHCKSDAAPMDSVSIAKAGGASDDFAEYLKEQEELNAVFS